MLPPILQSIAQQKAVGLLDPQWRATPLETITGSSGAGMFVPKYKELQGKASEIFGRPGSFSNFIEGNAPGTLFDDLFVPTPTAGANIAAGPQGQEQLYRMMRDPHLEAQAKKVDEMGHGVWSEFRRRFPNAPDPKLSISNIASHIPDRGSYHGLRNVGVTDFNPANLAHILAQSSVRGKHPVLVNMLADATKNINRIGKWVIPGVTLAGAALGESAPEVTGSPVFQALSKYGPEAYLGTSLAASAIPALEMKRTIDLLPKGSANRQLFRAQARKNALKMLASYGLLRGLSSLAKKRMAESSGDMEKSGSLIDAGKEYLHNYGGKYLLTPAILAAIFSGMKSKSESVDTEKIPSTARPLFATITNPASAAALISTPGGFQ
jgi:hypothetical protein